ncbi:Fanconi anemia group D2 protein, partial [Balamuthia mandrillaris]
MKRKQDNADEGWETVKKGRGAGSSSSSLSQGPDSSNSVLYKVLRGGGWSLSGPTHVIADPTQLRRHVSKTFTQSAEALKKAQEELAEIIDNDEELQHWLRPALTSPDQTEHVATSDCVLKLLLSVDAIQPFLIERLLEKLPQFIVEDTDYGSSLPRQILRQFRWLDSVVESEALTTKLMEVMKACPSYLKKEIITFIPDIIDDYGFPMIVNDLQELMEQESELTVPILDTLSNLNLPSELTDQVRNSVLRSLPSAALDDLPVVVSFLLRSTNKDNVQQVAKKIRCNLDFAPLLSNRQAKSPEAATKKMGETLTLEAIKSGIRSQQYILKAFLKEIQTVPSQAEHKLLDLWLLWVLHSIPAHKKATEAIFRKKIVAGHFTSALLSHSIAGHTQALAPYHASLLALQELFLRSPEPAIRQFGVAQYVLVFQHFTEKYQRQELLGNIITHIGSGASEEIDAALSVLLKLIESKAMREQLASYSVYIQGILDYLHTLQDNQIRNIFTVFCQLVSRASHLNTPSTLGNEVMIMIRKLLSSPADSAKKIGILGGLAMIRSYASEQNEDMEHEVTSGFAASQGEAMNSANRTEIYTLLHLLISSCSVSSPYCYSFLCDELVEIVREGLLDCKVVDELKTLAENELTEKFLVPEGEELSDVLSSNPKPLWFDLNDQVNNIAVMLYYMIKEEKANLLIKLAPLLRLLKVSRVFLDEPLEGIDALVGCPLFLISPDDFEDFTRLGAVMQSNVGLALFFGLCWCRELINSFYSSSDITIKHKVVKRVEHLREMEQMLQRCLSQEPRVLLSITKFISTIEDIPPLTIDKQLLKKDTGGSSSSKDQMEDVVPKDDDEIGENEPLQNAKPRLLVTPHVDFLRPFIRELELGSCLILAYSAIAPDSESFSESTSALDEAIELEPSVLHYLLQDLNNKLTVL